MPNEPGRPSNRSPEAAEYRRRQEEKAQRRKKRQMQRLIFLGACLLGVVLLVVCVVLIVRAIMKPSDDKPKSDPSASVSVSGQLGDAGTSGNLSWPVASDSTAWNLVLFNSQSPMPEGFTFEEGTVSGDSVGYTFDARIVEELGRMIADCNAVEGHSLSIISGTRGKTTQDGKYNDLKALYESEGNTPEEADKLAREVDPPHGESDHQTGLAVDFITSSVTEAGQAFAQTPEYAWLMSNAQNYGFILRYPESKAAITGISYQPYHFRYVGVEDAKVITQAGICLEEYLAQMPASQPASSTAESGDISSSASGSSSVPKEGDSAG